MIQNYYEILQEHRRKNSSSKDIDAIEEEKMIFRSIREVMLYSEEVVRNNLYKTFDTTGSPTFSIQVAIFNNTQDMLNGKNDIVVPSPFIDTTSDRGTELRMNAFLPSLDHLNKNSLGLMWGLAHELFREPAEGFFASNIVKFKLYSHTDYTQEVTSTDSNRNKLEITFPLRVQPAESKIEELIKCVKISFGNADHYELKYRKYTIINLIAKR
jgi:hypothetical protein